MPDTWTLFDDLAGRYDQVVPFFAQFAEQVIEYIAPTPGSRLLDIGAGRGALALAAAQRGCDVTAVDGSTRMVQLLTADNPHLPAHVMDIHHLDFPDASFDVVTGGFVIHLVTDPGRCMDETLRVLKTRGRLALTVPAASSSRSGPWAIFDELVARFEPLAGPARPGTQIDVPATMRRAGYRDLGQQHLDVHIPIETPQKCWDFLMSHGFAGLVQALPPADAAELKDHSLAIFTRMQQAGGIVVERGATLHTGIRP